MTPAEVVRAIQSRGTIIRADSACFQDVPNGACREMIVGLSSTSTHGAPIPICRLVLGEDARVLQLQELPIP
jgi:hypothetical protein